MTIKEFVEEARKIHGDKYDYKSVDFIKKTDKVDIVCHSNAEYVKGNIFTNNMEGFLESLPSYGSRLLPPYERRASSAVR